MPNLKGTCIGKSLAIKHGKGESKPHRSEQDVGKVTDLDFTLTIDSQDGRGFTGTHASAMHTE